uniref:Uncharacterized protein n=1 Tax=Romanomermis culicivorax TaxID=13658 RepID=A0A915IJU8_ROMCU
MATPTLTLANVFDAAASNATTGLALATEFKLLQHKTFAAAERKFFKYITFATKNMTPFMRTRQPVNMLDAIPP